MYNVVSGDEMIVMGSREVSAGNGNLVWWCDEAWVSSEMRAQAHSTVSFPFPLAKKLIATIITTNYALHLYIQLLMLLFSLLCNYLTTNYITQSNCFFNMLISIAKRDPQIMFHSFYPSLYFAPVLFSYV